MTAPKGNNLDVDGRLSQATSQHASSLAPRSGTKSDEIIVVNTKLDHAEYLAAIQPRAYPNLNPMELFTAAHYRRHLEIFPEGQFVALDTANGMIPVGATSTLRYNFDFNKPEHKFIEIIGYGWLTKHQPEGIWLYGCDMMVDPAYQGRGIASKLYRARFELVKQLNLRGQIAVGMMPGYKNYRQDMTIDEYAERVRRNEISDPTLSKQLKSGFRFVQVIHNYLHDETSGNASALIVWDNPYYFPLTPSLPHAGSRRSRISKSKWDVHVRGVNHPNDVKKKQES